MDSTQTNTWWWQLRGVDNTQQTSPPGCKIGHFQGTGTELQSAFNTGRKANSTLFSAFVQTPLPKPKLFQFHLWNLPHSTATTFKYGAKGKNLCFYYVPVHSILLSTVTLRNEWLNAFYDTVWGSSEYHWNWDINTICTLCMDYFGQCLHLFPV